MSAENPASDKYNVTYTGACPECSTTTTFTGYGSHTMPPGPLGYEATEPIPCMLDGVPVPVRLVGVCLAPFEATKPDDDVDEDEGGRDYLTD